MGSQQKPRPPAASPAPARRSPLPLIGAFLAGAAVAGGVALATRPPDPPPAPPAPSLPPTAKATASPSFDGKAGPWGVFEYTQSRSRRPPT